jgi:putative hemolysin
MRMVTNDLLKGVLADAGSGRQRARAFLFSIFAALVAAFAFSGAALATVDEGTTPPSISSDKADYAPGELVTLRGSHWRAGETVTIDVNDDQGQTWRRTVDVTADADGTIVDTFNLPDWFVAQYTVTATGPVSGTAVTSFTDGNVKVSIDPADVTATITATLYNAPGCTGTTTAKPAPGTVGVGNTESLRLDAAATGTAPSAPTTRSFLNWTVESGVSFTVIAGTSGRSICVSGNFNGSKDAIAHYEAASTNTAPVIARNNATVTVNEGQTAANTGTWSDANAGDTVTLTTSVGTVTKSGTNASGTWSWSFATTDGTDQSQTVTITANDGTTTSSTTFALTVNNVAPTVAFTASPASANEGQTKTYTYSISDPGADTQTVSTSCGANGTSSNASSTSTSGTFDCTFADGPASSTVSVQATDSDGAAGSTITQVVTVSNVAPSISISGAASVNEGSSYSLTLGAVTDPGTDTLTSWIVHWGDGGSDTYTSNGAKTHTYADGPDSHAITVDLIDEDGTFLDRANALSVTVDNVAPTVALSGANDLSVNEGSQHTYGFSVSDPGADTFTVVSVSCGTGGSQVGTTTTTPSGGSFVCSFPDGPASPIVSVQVKDSDNANSNTATQTVTVANVKPSISLTGDATADEGTTHTYSYTVTDPGQDSHTITTACGLNGTKVSSSDSYNAGTGLGSFQCFFADGPATTNVTATVTDSDGASDTDNQVVVVTVSNVAPTVTLSAGNDLSVDEGSQHTYSFTTSDPGEDNFALLSTDCGLNGSQVGTDTFNTTTGAGSFVCSFPDGPASSTVSVQVEDSDGADSNTAAQTVTVANVAPTVTLSALNDLLVDEGTMHSYSYTISDPGQDDVFSVTTSCSGTGWKILLSDAFTNSSGSFTCRFDDGPNSSTVSASATDSDGDTGAAATQTVTVNNVAPTVALAATNDLSVNEETQHTYSFTVTDPGVDTFSVVSVSCGTGGNQVGTTTTTASGGSFVCSFPDGPASPIVSVQVKDSDNANSNTATQTITVANVAPTVTLSASNDLAVDEGESATYSYSISDPGQDTVASVDTDCGANGTVVPLSDTHTNTSGSFGCTFPDGPASSTVSANATDSDGDTGNTDTQTVAVANVKPRIVLTGDATADEGSTHTYSYTVTDPGQDTHTITTACGANGAKVAASDSYNAGTGLGSFQCFFADGPATTNVTATVTDSDGASDTDNQVVVVTVNNVDPVVTAAADDSSNEGASHSFALGSFTDPGTDSAWDVTVDWGDGSTDTNFNVTSAGSLGSKPHTYADGPSDHTVTVTVTDKDGGTDADTFSAHVDNVAPSIAISGAASVNEGSSYSLTLGAVTDPGTDTVSSYVVHWGDGSQDSYATNGAKTHTYADGPASHSITVDLVDEDGTFLDRANALSVTVNNVAPSILISGAASVNEGSSYSLTLGAVTDPGSDTVSSYVVHWGDGNTDTYPSNGAKTHTYADGPDSHAIKVDLVDEDGTFLDSANALSVTVNNVAPTVTLAAGNDLSVNEGTSHTYSFSVTDPGVDTFSVVSVSCGANGNQVGSTATTTSGGSFVCSFPDGPASSTVSVQVKDSDNDNSNTATQTVAVANVAPTVAFTSAPASANEGESKTYSFSVTDPGVDTFTVLSVSCGSGGSQVGTTTTTLGGGSFVCSFPDGPAGPIVSVQVKDSDNDNSNIATQTVTVANVAPTVSLSAGNDLSVTEGTQHTYSFSVSDPGIDTFSVVSVSCGANGSQVGTTTTTTSGGSLVCSFPDGPASSTVSVQVKDSDNANSNSATQTVTVGNVAPVITSITPAYGTIQAMSVAVNVVANFTDAGTADTHTCTIDWDNGFPAVAGTVVESNGSGTCKGSQTYTAPGVYTIKVKVVDKDGGVAEGETLVVVYDPSAGFVTGGGWINSPAGAYYLDPALTGNANFGFVSKYQKGATIPTGQTEFQFQTGNLNFHSESYQWLIVSANTSKAQYKGTGTINGTGNYGFLLTAWDSNPDRFRIKIWNVGGAVVYDNNLGASDDIDVTVPMAIAGGSIVIHK